MPHDPDHVDIDGTDVRLEGDGPATVVMVHGWPDTWRLWEPQVAALRADHRCVRFSLPGFEPGSPRRAAPLDEIVALLRRIVERVGGGAPVTLMLHDWGAVFGYQFALRHPELVTRVVGLDIGDAGSPEHLRCLPLRAKLGIAVYQLWLALAWRVGGRLGDGMTRRMAHWLRCPTDPALVHSGMNYPYDITWTGSHGSYRGMRPVRLACPLLYLYGRRKPVPFHSPPWLAEQQARPGCAVVGIDGGHWFGVRQADAVNREIRQWLARTGPGA